MRTIEMVTENQTFSLKIKFYVHTTESILITTKRVSSEAILHWMNKAQCIICNINLIKMW